MHVGHVQRVEYLQRRGPANDVRRVVIAHQQEYRNAGAGKLRHATRELPLVRLGRVAALVRVAAEEHQVDGVIDGVVHQLIVSVEEVSQAGGKPRLRVHAAVVLDAYVQVGEVQDSHWGFRIFFVNDW